MTVMDLEATTEVEVSNDPEAELTFQTANGESWIDITLARKARISG